jgi:hypothetical protein
MPGLWMIAGGLAELLLLSHCSRSATPREAAAMNNSLETLGDLADLRPKASREAKAGSTRRPPRIHRTGRNHQFNAKGDRRHDPAVQRHLRRAAVGRRPSA